MSDRVPADRVPTLATVLRTLAVVIAVAGVIDPVFTRERAGAPTIALLQADTLRDTRVVQQLRATLARARATITAAPGPNDEARVWVGNDLPIAVSGSDSVPTFVLAPNRVSITSVTMPAQARLASRVPVMVQVASPTRAAIVVQLVQQGVVLAHDTATLLPNVERTVAMSWAPATVGAQAIAVRAMRTDARADTAQVLQAVAVDSSQWRVVSYDARPSWMSTFVRRALERDPRFSVRSRIVTTSAPQAKVSRATPRAPQALSTLDGHDVDVLLLGAPDALSASDVAALRHLVADQGVSAVLLFDGSGRGAVDGMLAAGGWRSTARQEPVRMRGARLSRPQDSTSLAGLMVGTPDRVPVTAEPLVMLGRAPVIWRQPLGLGELLVSGAFDSWRYRDATQSTFDGTWRDLVAEAAARRAPAVRIEPPASVVAPGERARFVIASTSTPTVTYRSAQGETAVPVRATSTEGVWQADWHAGGPDASALQKAGLLVASADGEEDQAAVVITAEPGRNPDALPAVVRPWAVAHGGQVTSSVDSLGQLVERARQVRYERLPWHPMRSPWWILPFTLALAGDWWLRRRRGWP